MKTILIISEWPTPWGVGKKIGVPGRYALIKLLAEKGFRINIVSRKSQDYDETQEKYYNQFYFTVPFFQFGVKKLGGKKFNNLTFFLYKLFSLWDIGGFTIIAFWKAVRISKDTSPCLVMCAGSFGTLATKLLGYWYKVPTVTRQYGGILYRQFRAYDSQWKRILYCDWVSYLALKVKTDQIIATEDDCKIDLMPQFIKIPSPMYLLPIGINRDEFVTRNLEKFNILKVKHELESFDILIGSFGRWVSIKNNELLLKALKIVLHNTNNQSVGCILVGSGPNRGNYLNIIQEHNLTQHVKLINQVPRNEIGQYYYLVDIYFSVLSCPNKNNTFLEAMITGRATITSSDLRENEFIINNKTVLMVQESSEEEEMVKRIAEKILLLINDPGLRKKLGQNAKEYASKYIWTVEEQVQAEYQILEKLTTGAENSCSG